MSALTNLHISCIVLQVYLTSQLLKLPHVNTSKDFSLAQQSSNGVTGISKHTNDFHKTWNPLKCQLSSCNVIACNCYRHFNGLMVVLSKCAFCSLSYLYISKTMLYYSTLHFLSHCNSLAVSPSTNIFMNIKKLFSEEIRE